MLKSLFAVRESRVRVVRVVAVYRFMLSVMLCVEREVGRK